MPPDILSFSPGLPWLWTSPLWPVSTLRLPQMGRRPKSTRVPLLAGIQLLPRGVVFPTIGLFSVTVFFPDTARYTVSRPWTLLGSGPLVGPGLLKQVYQLVFTVRLLLGRYLGSQPFSVWWDGLVGRLEPSQPSRSTMGRIPSTQPTTSWL